MFGGVALLLVWVTGELLLGLKARREPGQMFREVPLAFGLGWVSLFLVWLLLCWAGPVAVGWYWLAPLLLLVIRFAARHRSTAVGAVAPHASWETLDRLLLATLALIAVSTAAGTVLLPILDWDTRILWALKTKMLALEPTVTGEAFRDPYRLHIHPRYPLMLPWLGALLAGHQGEYLELHYQLLLNLIGVLALWQFCRLVAEGAGLRVALLMGLVMTLTGAWQQANFNSSAELALVLFLLLGIGQLCRWHETGSRWDWLTGVMLLVGLAMVKNEGVLLVCSLLIGYVVWQSCLSGVRGAAKSGLLFGGGWLVGYSLWLLHVRMIPAVSDEHYWQRLHWNFIASGLDRASELFFAISRELLNLSLWHLVWALPVVSLWFLWSRAGKASTYFALLAVTTSLYSFGVLFVYLLSPWRDLSMHVAVTFSRVMLPVLPLLLLMLGCRLAGNRGEAHVR